MLEAFDTDYRTWSYWVWFLHAFGVYCGVGFVWFWIRFHSLERGAREGLPHQLERYNKALQGFPNAVYAKMMGKGPIHADQPSTLERLRQRLHR